MTLPTIDERPRPTPSVADRLKQLTEVLERHPHAAIAALDEASSMSDARGQLTSCGIKVGGHPSLRGRSPSEYLVTADVLLLGELAIDARAHGTGKRSIRIRDGREALLHMVYVGGAGISSIMVLVPQGDDVVARTPQPTAIEAAPRVGVMYTDGTAVVTRAEDSMLAIVGLPREQVEGRPVLARLYADDHEASIVSWIAAKEQRGVARRSRGRLFVPEGLLWVEISLTNNLGVAGDDEVRVEVRDIAREVAVTEALAAERELLGQLAEALPVGIAKFDAAGRIQYFNERLGVLLGGTNLEAVLASAVDGQVEPPDLGDAFLALFHEGRAASVVVEHDPRDPSRHLEWTLRPDSSATGSRRGGVLCVADVTEATDLRAKLEHRATTDVLTGCLNRAGTISAVEQALDTVGLSGGTGLVFFDLDNFKTINDELGHAAGDRVLKRVAHHLQQAVREVDVVGRLGGDEFVVVAPGLPSLDAAHALAERLSEHVDRHVDMGDFAVEISATFGVSWAASGDVDELLAEADRAMYASKSKASGAPPHAGVRNQTRM